MPEITLYRKPTVIPDSMVRSLTAALRTSVAQQLNDPTSKQKLTPEQVEVRVMDGHPLDDNTGDLEIKVSDKDFQSHDAWTDQILDVLAELVRNIVPEMVDTPPRLTDTWLELDLGNRSGRKIWPTQAVAKSTTL